MNLLERLKYIRERVLKLSQEDFAKSLGVSQKTISRWENGTNEPQLEAIRPLLEKYNIDINWLLTGTGSMTVEEKSCEENELTEEEREFLGLLTRASEGNVDAINEIKGIIKGLEIAAKKMKEKQ